MKKIFFWICISFSLTGCSDKKTVDKYPVIDVASGIGNYQKVYCSDFFSSMELIPLETDKNYLIGRDPNVIINDHLIFICSIVQEGFPVVQNFNVFDRSGKFLNQIGNLGNGPGEYQLITNIFLHQDKPTIFVTDYANILEYGFNGTFIRSFPMPTSTDGNELSCISYLGDNLFVGAFDYFGTPRYKYIVFDENSNIIKYFPAYYFIDDNARGYSKFQGTLDPFRIDQQVYVKDVVNDTLYTLANLNLQPAYVFDFGKYSCPPGTIKEGQIEITGTADAAGLYVSISPAIVGTPKYLFYNIFVPRVLPRPKSRPSFLLNGREMPTDLFVYGIYDKERNTNTLLDTDPYLQKGIINDLNGGLSFVPRYYAGNGVVADIWLAEDMKEILTEEYFATLKIKDKQAHQKLRELLRKLGEEDNPVVVIAKLK